METVSQEVIRADPRQRIRALVLFSCVLALIGGVLYVTVPDVQRLGTAPLRAEFRWYLIVSTLLGGALAAAAGLRIGHLCWRTLQSRQYPPPGTRVIRDTLVRRGAPAERIAWIGLALVAVLLVIAVVLVPIQLARILEAFSR